MIQAAINFCISCSIPIFSFVSIFPNCKAFVGHVSTQGGKSLLRSVSLRHNESAALGECINTAICRRSAHGTKGWYCRFARLGCGSHSFIQGERFKRESAYGSPCNPCPCRLKKGTPTDQPLLLISSRAQPSLSMSNKNLLWDSSNI